VAFGITTGEYSFSYHHPRVDGINADLARPKFLCQGSRNRVHRGFGCVVNYTSRRGQRTGKRTDVDNATAVGIEMLECFLGDENYSENVSVKHSMKLFLGDFFQRHEFINAGVVNENVDLAESFLRG